jgi:hypothetical protein
MAGHNASLPWRLGHVPTLWAGWTASPPVGARQRQGWGNGMACLISPSSTFVVVPQDTPLELVNQTRAGPATISVTGASSCHVKTPLSSTASGTSYSLRHICTVTSTDKSDSGVTPTTPSPALASPLLHPIYIGSDLVSGIFI